MRREQITLPTATPSNHLLDGVSEPSYAGNLTNVHNIVSKRVLQLSPDRSPHKVGKTDPKRQQTVAVRNLTSSLSCIHSKKILGH